MRKKLYEILRQEFLCVSEHSDIKIQQYTLKVSSGLSAHSPVEELMIRREAFQFMLSELQRFNIPVEKLHSDLTGGCILGGHKDEIMCAVLELYLWKNESIQKLSEQIGITRRKIYFYKDKLLSDIYDETYPFEE